METVKAKPPKSARFFSPAPSIKAVNNISKTAIAQGFIESTTAAPVIAQRE